MHLYLPLLGFEFHNSSSFIGHDRTIEDHLPCPLDHHLDHSIHPSSATTLVGTDLNGDNCPDGRSLTAVAAYALSKYIILLGTISCLGGSFFFCQY